jgi:glycosyltransferase involved in cell wall biosynthesis
LRIVYNGVDLSPDLSGTIPEKYSETFQPDELQIVYLGRLDVKKGVELLIRAVASVSPHLKVRCHFFGDGYQKERFERLASDNNVSERIHFWGYSPDVRKWLHKFDVLVLPSFTEGMGIAILEAMAAGLPVIATNIGGIPEAVIDGETGYLVEPGDLNALAKRLEDLYRHKDKRVALGLAGKERVNHVFNLEFQIPKIIENYHLN